MQQISFISDQHFGHQNIIKLCNRPYVDTTEMTKDLIAKFNSRVKAGDLTYHLGDVFWRSLTEYDAMAIMDQLNGQHFYILGNHEEVMHKSAIQNNIRTRFIWVKDIATIHPAGYPHITLCHYAMRTWPKSHSGSWQLYGHSHGSLPENSSYSFDVGVDANGYFPVSIGEVADRMSKKVQPEIFTPEQKNEMYEDKEFIGDRYTP